MAEKCPQCDSDMTQADGKCPNCGSSARRAANKGVSAETLRSVSSAVMLLGSALLILDFLKVAKTYVGAIVLGIGFLLNGLAQMKKARAEKAESLKVPVIIIAAGVFVILAGFLFLYLDLR